MKRTRAIEIAALRKCLEIAPSIRSQCGMPDTSMNEKIDRTWCEIYSAAHKIESEAERALKALGVKP